MTEDPKSVVNRFWEAFNRNNPEVMDEIFAPGYALHDLSGRQNGNLDNLKDVVDNIHASLPGTYVTCEDQILAEGDRGVTRFTVHVPQQDAPDYPAETTVEFSGVSISRISGGKIEESWVNWEALRAEQELTPPPQEWRWPPWRW